MAPSDLLYFTGLQGIWLFEGLHLILPVPHNPKQAELSHQAR